MYKISTIRINGRDYALRSPAFVVGDTIQVSVSVDIVEPRQAINVRPLWDKAYHALMRVWGPAFPTAPSTDEHDPGDDECEGCTRRWTSTCPSLLGNRCGLYTTEPRE